MPDRCRSALCFLIAVVVLAPAYAQRELPPYWIAVSVDGAELDAGPEAQPPPAAAAPLATVAPGQTVTLRAKIVGGRRAYMMWPDTYANVGPNTTILARGFDEMQYEVQTEGFHGSGQWTATEERYTWNTGGQGALSPLDQTGERVAWTAPAQPGTHTLTVSGNLKLHFARQAPGGTTEADEESGALSRSIEIVVQGGAAPVPTPLPAPTPTPAPATPAVSETAAPMDQQQALQHILNRFNALGSGPVEGSYPTYVASAGFWNNVYSVFTDSNDNYVCGAWQGRVLEMLDAMRNGSPTEKAIFDYYEYGPVHAYFGGHQAVVIYPKGTDWQQTGTVLDPWPNQRPETFTIADWKSRFWFGVGPSAVYSGQYPLTGGGAYPAPRLAVPPEHMAILRRLPKTQRDQYLALTNQTERDAFIGALPPSATQTTAVAVHSPVRMLITDVAGHRVGWVDATTFAYEIPGADVDCFPEPGGGHGMVALLPQGEYAVAITGVERGTFGFTRAVPAPTLGSPVTNSLEIPVEPGETFDCQLSPTLPETPLFDGPGVLVPLEPVTVSAGASGKPSDPAVIATTTQTGAGPIIATVPVAGTTGGSMIAGGAAAGGITITSPRDGDSIEGRVTVSGTGRPGALVIVSTEVRSQEDDELLRDVPGSRHPINPDGTWQVWVAAPVPPANVRGPLYYVIKARWATQTEESEEARVRVFRAE